MMASRSRYIKRSTPAELERSLISERTRAWVEAAQRREDVADLFKVSRVTLYRALVA
jgi:hypothetical protein